MSAKSVFALLGIKPGAEVTAQATATMLEIDGIVASFTLEQDATGRAYSLVQTVAGAKMRLPLPREINGVIVPDEMRPFDFPHTPVVGEPFAARAYLVPVVDDEGEVRTQKRYEFATPDRGEISLAQVRTRAQVMADGYAGQPRLSTAGHSSAADSSDA